MSERDAWEAVRQMADCPRAPTHQRSARANPRADAQRSFSIPKTLPPGGTGETAEKGLYVDYPPALEIAANVIVFGFRPPK